MTKRSYVDGVADEIRMQDDRVLLRKVSGEKVSAGGLVIPETVKKNAIEAVVVAVGPGKRADRGPDPAHPLRIAPDVVSGDRVFVDQYAGIWVALGDEEFLVVEERDVLFRMLDVP